jgi:dTDP-4-dehydrorhamnose 3,5-epimerase
MSQNKRRAEIPGIQVFTARSFADERGFLLQSYVRSELVGLGIPGEFAQAIQSQSRQGVVRGLHFQWAPPQGKLIRCVQGAIWDVVVDLRHGSPALGCHFALEMSSENNRVLWVPAGFAHGFMAMVDASIVLYECTAEWAPAAEGGILWSDPELGIEWPKLKPIVSAKDCANPTLSEWLADTRSRNFDFRGDVG